jgi:glucose-1-phosphate cytidylyltransferase
MKVAILAGGFGTRLSEETDLRPKPMVLIGGKPILWHIMKHYSHYGFNEFVILLGYKGYFIKEYFANYFMHQSDITISLKSNKVEVHNNSSEPWKVTLVDTGSETMTGGRILRARKYLDGNTFMLTYGDGLSDIDLHKLVSFHQSQGKYVTLSSIQPEGRFGALNLQGDSVSSFLEKPKGDGSWVNGGFFVCEPKIFDYIAEGDSTIFERSPLEKLASESQLVAYKHEGFWRPMDTLRDKVQLEQLWSTEKAPWKVWSE